MIDPVIVGNATLYLGDCLEVLRTLPAASVHAIVTDPPAGIGFMGKDWDHHKGGREAWVGWMREIAAECLRVLKPGGHALVWAIPRTSHWTATAWETAGFEIRDRIAHVFGSGFPKSLDISKALDKRAGAERKVMSFDASKYRPNRQGRELVGGGTAGGFHADNGATITAPATPAAQQWAGWGTALKPAMEDWWLCRKPLDGTVAANVLAHGCGGLNVDGCRVNSGEPIPVFRSTGGRKFEQTYTQPNRRTEQIDVHNLGRFPTHLIHDGSAEVVALFPETAPSRVQPRNQSARPAQPSKGFEYGRVGIMGINDAGGTAARFFYCAKASQDDRDEGLDGFERATPGLMTDRKENSAGLNNPRAGAARTSGARNHHPTVKPAALMRYLCRLITPPGGVILDPFMGSGSTGKGALLEGFHFIGIEREAEYHAIAAARLRAAQVQPDLFHQAAAL